MNRPPTTLDIWKQLFDPAHIGLFLIGSICLTVFGEGFYGVLEGVLSSGVAYFSSRSGFVQIMAMLLSAGILWGVLLMFQFRMHVIQRFTEKPVKHEESAAKPCEGLILFVSANPKAADMTIIEHHRQALRHCWLIVSQESEKRGIELSVHLQGQGIDAHTLTIADVWSIDAAFDTVTEAIQASRHNLKPSKTLIVDITGGTKVMSVGAVLACLEADVPIEYTATHPSSTGARARRARSRFRSVLVVSR